MMVELLLMTVPLLDCTGPGPPVGKAVLVSVEPGEGGGEVDVASGELELEGEV